MTWRRRGTIAVAAALALGGAFLAGRASAPARVVEHVQERAGERQTQQSYEASGASSTATTAALAAANLETIRRIRVVTAPDGATTTEATEETRAATRREDTRTETRVEYRNRVQVVVRDVWRERAVERVTETSSRPWRAGLLGGMDIMRRGLVGAYAGRALGPLDVIVSVIVPPRDIAQTGVIAGVGWRW